MSERKEDQLRREWQEAQDGLNPGETEIERTLDNIATIKSGWHRTRGKRLRSIGSPDPEFGFAYFPDLKVHQQGSKAARAAEDAWEARTLAMHAAQEPIRLEAKPAENALAKRVVRAD